MSEPPVAGSWSWLLRTFRLALALLFAASTLLYTILWMQAVRWVPDVELGFTDVYLAPQHALSVTTVKEGSPAEQAGVRPGDRIVAVDGNPVEDEPSLYRIYRRYKAGDTVRLTIDRPAHAAQLTLAATFRQRRSSQPTERLARGVLDSFPAPFVLVGLTVLFLRMENPTVWLLALLFASFAAVRGFPDGFASVPAALRPFAIAWKGLAMGLIGPLFYFVFAIFPVRSALDRRMPWLKWVAVGSGLVVAIDIRPDPPLARLVGRVADANIVFACAFVFLFLGLAELVEGYFHATAPDARRRIRVVFWGTVLGVGPSIAVALLERLPGFRQPDWLATTLNLVLFLFPLSFAYAVVKHRVLEIPVLLKRSARYLLVQRGFLFLLSMGSIAVTLLFAMWFPRVLRPVLDVAGSSSIALGAVFGTVLLWGGSQVHRKVSGKIDRSFFRAAYDARTILEDLAEQTRTATGSTELAHTLEQHLKEALQPSSLVIYLRDDQCCLRAASSDVPGGLSTLPVTMPALEDLAPLNPDYLVPMMSRDGGLAGLVVLGPRRSEEPYSGEDKRLLASVASQAATAMENIRLAQEIADRMERERRVAREMEIAKEVQLRLLPQTGPSLKTMEAAARCIQARSVGGDYYDFLDLGEDRAGLVLADVSGKGVHAALLVANLQAYLRSQSAITPRDPVHVLEQVNGILWKSTAAQHYATLFFGVYDDVARQLSYVNCGHNPPLCLRQDGRVEGLSATATVIGLFEQWECSLGIIQLAPGDLLAVFSDGVTEETRDDEEFGEQRLIDELQSSRERPLDEIITGVFESVQRFSPQKQSDDLTLLIARVLRDGR